MNENNEVNGVEHSVATIAGQIRNENGQVVSEVAKYGIKLDGTPRQKPGRKATGSVNKTKNIFVYRGQVVSRGKPSLEQVKHRRRVTIPLGVKYDAAVHGVGERLAEDDQRVVEWEAEIANRELARKAAKVAAQSASPEVSPTAPNNEVAPDNTPTNNDTVSL
jgi:hypothetical protein